MDKFETVSTIALWEITCCEADSCSVEKLCEISNALWECSVVFKNVKQCEHVV